MDRVADLVDVLGDMVRSSQPLIDLRRAVALLTYSAFSNDVATPLADGRRELEALAEEIGALAQALQVAVEKVSDPVGRLGGETLVRAGMCGDVVKFDLRRLGAAVRLVEPISERELGKEHPDEPLTQRPAG